MPASPVKRRLAAIPAADVAGYSRMGQLGRSEEATAAMAELDRLKLGNERYWEVASPYADPAHRAPRRRPAQGWYGRAQREELPSQRDNTRRISGGSVGWLINGCSRARLTITAIAL
jgi:hypothetical protein